MSLARSKVWIVDDSPMDAEHTRKVVVARCDVEVFTDGSAVLERLSAGPVPDALIIDWVMPGISGIEVIEFLRSQIGAVSQVPVLLLTVNGQPEQVGRGLDAGANDYLAKPFAPRELEARLEALLRGARLKERALTAERSVLMVLENAPDGLLAVGADGRVTFANANAARIFGQASSALVGQPVSKLLPALPVPLRVGSHAELPDVHLGDRVFAPVLGELPPDSLATTTVALRDVTERRTADQRRLDFYSIIAHDLRSPLAAIGLRNAALVRGLRGPVSPQMVEELQKTDRSLKLMKQIIDDFLELAKLEGSPQRMQRVSLATLVEQTILELAFLLNEGCGL